MSLANGNAFSILVILIPRLASLLLSPDPSSTPLVVSGILVPATWDWFYRAWRLLRFKNYESITFFFSHYFDTFILSLNRLLLNYIFHSFVLILSNKSVNTFNAVNISSISYKTWWIYNYYWFVVRLFLQNYDSRKRLAKLKVILRSVSK